MKGDFSRFTFDSKKHYRGVRLQQGRVQLDADWNEQVDIQLAQQERTIKDLLGAQGAPKAQAGFTIALPEASTAPTLPDVKISQGQRYVDGILCISEAEHNFSEQPDFPGAKEEQLAAPGEQQLVYLDVWQQHVTAHEDSTLREVALDGLDTTTRLKTVAQVKFWKVPEPLPDEEPAKLACSFEKFRAEKLQAKGKLEARKSDEGSIAQNQLYRVEIHQVEPNRIGFKWSRENGAVAYSINEIIATEKKVVINLKDVKAQQLDLRIHDWVEITSNAAALNGQVGVLGTVTNLQPDLLQIQADLLSPLESCDPATCAARHCVLLRWDQKERNNEGFAQGIVMADLATDKWIPLENGIQVRFTMGTYAVGDYWLIPARSNLRQGTGDLLWQTGASQPPSGVIHHYAALAFLQRKADQWEIIQDKTTFRTLPLLSDEVDNLTQHMTAAEGNIDQLQKAVQKLREDVDKLETEVEQLGKRFDTLEKLQLYQNFHAKDRDLDAGMLVAYSDSDPDHVEKVNAHNATLLLGVVVETIVVQPHNLVCRVAMQGRTKCKVVGAVKPGMLLVPSGKPGYAEPAGLYLQPGTVLGKVLTVPNEYRNGTKDEVDILITLN